MLPFGVIEASVYEQMLPQNHDNKQERMQQTGESCRICDKDLDQ